MITRQENYCHNLRFINIGTYHSYWMPMYHVCNFGPLRLIIRTLSRVSEYIRYYPIGIQFRTVFEQSMGTSFHPIVFQPCDL